jgi:hypothetical protein
MSNELIGGAAPRPRPAFKRNQIHVAQEAGIASPKTRTSLPSFICSVSVSALLM